MDVAVSELRAHLSEWLERARSGEDVVVTDRGTPVARLVGVSSATTLERLTSEGVISRPAAPARPSATGRPRVTAGGSVSDLVAEQRR
jgi:prevent-host-death family protein